MPELEEQRVKVEKGFFNLPKELIIEALLFKNRMLFSTAKGTGWNEYHYYCSMESCKYKIKIIEKPDILSSLTSNMLIINFKSFDWASSNDLQEEISQVMETGIHTCNTTGKNVEDFI